MITKCYYRDHLHLVELRNEKLSNTIIKAIKHCNLTLPTNTKKHKATAALTIQDFPLSSRYSIKTLNPKLSSIILTHKNTMFSEIACQTRDNRCNNTMDQDLPNNSART